MFADTHKIIATNIYDSVYHKYGLKLHKKKLLWGSIAPDILPKYRFIRHYKDESIDYIAKEIIKIIYISRYIEFNNILDPIAIKILSKKIGIISHYLADYVCLPHANRWTFTKSTNSMVNHIKYESDLNEFAKTFSFNKNIIDTSNIDIYDSKITGLKDKITKYINDVVDEYLLINSLERDLNFASALNIKITYFILYTIETYSEELHRQFIFEF
ncbi:zinc dependent phospholipase C family protein [Lachnospiraceae bacterium NSJ-29]|uniref:Zinc dependent phospholipase C family protein n=1 Tax=Wansuia hejianensis TaxID=2763667 RepID=A0A926F1U2_9FIRM|nr:zinc dependent phospholipase C family protein [Wansuia hejianensis]